MVDRLNEIKRRTVTKLVIKFVIQRKNKIKVLTMFPNETSENVKA